MLKKSIGHPLIAISYKMYHVMHAEQCHMMLDKNLFHILSFFFHPFRWGMVVLILIWEKQTETQTAACHHDFSILTTTTFMWCLKIIILAKYCACIS